MKECQVIHIHDGDWQELVNGNWHFAERAEWAAKMMALYLNAGYEVLEVVPSFSPGDGHGRPFYKDGIIVILVREAGSGPEITLKDWQENNQLSPQRQAAVEAYRTAEEAAYEEAEDMDIDFDELEV